MRFHAINMIEQQRQIHDQQLSNPIAMKEQFELQHDEV